MRRNAIRFVRWAPRASGVLMAAFLALFALDAFEGRSFIQGVPFFLVHLIPALLVLAVVALAWRYEWIGAALFVALAVGYAVMVNWRLDWVAVISVPLVMIGALFLASWRYRTAPGAEG